MTDHLRSRLLAATAVAREAGRLARRFYEAREKLAIEYKGYQDVVSRADRAVEELFRERLGGSFPEDDFLGEEGGGTVAERLWVIDPIDGTANFLRGLPYWAVTLAYVEEGRTEIGVTYDPVHDELFVARRGGGTTRNGEPVRVSGCTDPTRACVAVAFGFKQNSERYLRMVEGLTAHGIDHRRLGSSALKLCHVADGRLDGAASLRCNAWDVLAGILLVREAGGVGTEYADGCALDQPRGALACTPGIRAELERIVGQPAT